MHLKELLRDVRSLPKTIYFNYKVLPLKDAVRLPFYVDCDIRFGRLCKGVVQIPVGCKRFQIKLGKRALDDVPETTKGFVSMAMNSKIIFSGEAEFAYGIILNVLNNGSIIIGDGFYCNKNCSIVSSQKIMIGNNVLMGWNVSIRDNDGGTHKIYVNGMVKDSEAGIPIADHCWLCANSTVLKGVTLASDIVVAYDSCVTKSFPDSNIIIAGSPATVVRRNVMWER